jgi:hypothetical protein
VVELVKERLLERDQYSLQTMTNATSMAHDFRWGKASGAGPRGLAEGWRRTAGHVLWLAHDLSLLHITY